MPASAIVAFGGQFGATEVDDDDDDYDIMLNTISHGIEQLSADIDSA